MTWFDFVLYALGFIGCGAILAIPFAYAAGFRAKEREIEWKSRSRHVPPFHQNERCELPNLAVGNAYSEGFMDGHKYGALADSVIEESK